MPCVWLTHATVIRLAYRSKYQQNYMLDVVATSILYLSVFFLTTRFITEIAFFENVVNV